MNIPADRYRLLLIEYEQLSFFLTVSLAHWQAAPASIQQWR